MALHGRGDERIPVELGRRRGGGRVHRRRTHRPFGRQPLLDDLVNEMIPYTPEELVAIANREFAWCEAEMKKASKEMGFGDDWKAALEKVKGLGEPPGDLSSLENPDAVEEIRRTRV